MGENKKQKRSKAGYLLLEFGVVLAGAAGMFAICRFRQQTVEVLLRNVVFTAMGLAVAGFHIRQEVLYNKLEYDNGQHVFRFWTCFYFCLAAAFICGFLPVGGWPFNVIYVVLSLFSNMSTGILSASVLLMMPVAAGAGDVSSFLLYFVSGVFAVTLFRHLEKEFRIGIPLFLSMLCLLLCETGGIILQANARPDLEMFVIPVANIIISSILLTGCLKLFSAIVVYRYRETYLELNDTENQLLSEWKKTARKEYFQGVHTAYFCERIAGELGLDADALKCAGYYHKYPLDAQFLADKQFPPKAAQILCEYLDRKAPMRQKETAVLLCSDAVVSSITFLFTQSNEKILDYDKVIDAVFKKLFDAGTFNSCDISMRELCVMQKKFKEEKLYYDFLR